MRLPRRHAPASRSVADLRHQVIRKIAAVETSGPRRAAAVTSGHLAELYALLDALELLPRTTTAPDHLVERWLEVRQRPTHGSRLLLR